jgi:hypothetical protein
MRERSGSHICFNDDTKIWLDTAHSSFRLPRRSPQRCVEPGCFATTPLVYCQNHYPSFRAFTADELPLGNDGIPKSLQRNLSKFLDIVNQVAKTGLQGSKKRSTRVQQLKAIVLVFDMIVLNWHILQNYHKFVDVCKQKMLDLANPNMSAYSDDKMAVREFTMRYAFLKYPGVEFMPTVYPLNLEMDGSSSGGSVAAPLPTTVSRNKVAAAAKWLASTGVYSCVPITM